MKRILFTLLAMLIPTLAMADVASGPFSPPSTDVSMKVLDALFGNLGTFGAGGSDAFGAVMQIFNGAVLIVGGILATYTLLAGTLGTAHDGEMLGKKFSSVWIPIRYSLGTALVLPVINGQYATINWIVGWLLVQGAGLADSVWTTYMSSGNIKKQMSVGLTPPNASALGYKIFGSLVCMRGYEELLKDGGSNGLVDPILLDKNATTFAVSKTQSWNLSNTIYQFGSTANGNGFSPTSCGTMTVKNAETPTVAKTDSASVLGLLGDPNLYLQSAYKVAEQNNVAAGVLVNTIDGVAKKWVASPTTDPSKEIDAAVATYQNTIKTNAAEIVSQYMNLDELAESAKRDGWAFAGAYYMKVSYLIDLAGRTTASIPEATGMKADNTKFTSAFYSKYGEGLKNMKMSDKEIGDFSLNKQSDVGGEEWSWMSWISSGFDTTRLVKHFMQGVGTFVLDDATDPILEMKRLGNWLLGTAATMEAAKMAGLVAFAAAPVSGTATPIVLSQQVGDLFNVVFPVMIGVGFTLSFVLPMMPFIMWMGVFLGWLIMAVEAVIISSMWAVYHLHPNGDDLTGKGANGYSLVLSLMLRPTFAVFGMIASINILYVLGTLINKVFSSAFLMSQTDSNIIMMLISLIAFPLIYCGMMWMIVRKCMSITSSIADELLKWFGGQGSSLGRTSEELGGHGAGTYMAGAAATNMAGKHLAGADAREKGYKQEAKLLSDRKNQINDHKNKLNAKFGEGTAEKKFAILGINSDEDFYNNQAASNAYDQGLELANSIGGDQAVEDFESRMAAASQDNFSSYGGESSKASRAIGNEVALESTSEKFSNQYGEAAADYLKQASMKTDKNGDQFISMSRMNEAGKFIQAAKQNLGDDFQAVLQNAVENSDNPAEMRQLIESQFKSAEAVQEEVKEEVKEEIQVNSDNENEK